MQKIKVRLPATITNFGPGVGSLGLALSLYVTVELSLRDDTQLVVEPEGEGAGRYGVALRHPVVLALSRLFQRLERSPFGFNVRIRNEIPLSSGLGAEAAFLVAGTLGGNNLMGNAYNRREILEVAAQISRADNAVTAVLGGLTATTMDTGRLTYRTLPITPMRIAVALPQLDRFPRPTPLERVPTVAAMRNLARLPLFLEAMKSGDLELLADTLNDELQAPRLVSGLRGFAEVTEAARDAGAVAVTIASDGPAVLAFAPANHAEVASVMGEAFQHSGVKARTWVLSTDTQGIVISVMRS